MKLNLFQKLKTILENKERWQSVEGAVEFEKYVELLSKFFSEKETDRAKNMTKEIEEAYANALSGGFPIVISPPTGSYYKEPYLDPELRVSIRTPDAKAQEQNFVALQNAMADELGTLGVSQFADSMRKKTNSECSFHRSLWGQPYKHGCGRNRERHNPVS